MEDEEKNRCGSDESPAFSEWSQMKRFFLATAVAVAVGVLLWLGLSRSIPFLGALDQGRSGSFRYARQWRTQLLACQSLDDVKQHFNCVKWVPIGRGSATMVEVTAVVPGRVDALIKSFPDGKWIACAYGDSHGARGGGTVVARDSDGKVHVFFGHVCGRPFAEGNTVEDYADLTRHNRLEEQPLHKFE